MSIPPVFARAARVTIGALAASLLLVAAGCSSSEPNRSDDTLEAAEDDGEGDLLDTPVEVDDTKRASSNEREQAQVLTLPEPPAKPSKVLDADNADWQMDASRSYDGAQHVVSGRQFWSGPSDASYTVAAEADAGHFYLWVDVVDETVIDAGSEEVMADGIIVWLRDPLLADIVDSLPDSLPQKDEIATEVGILFTPDGQFWRYDDARADLYRGGIDAETTKTDEGYRLEAALSLEAFEQVARLPVDEVGFRVEVMDGDEPERRGEQTRLNMLPGDNRSRFALFEVDGLLPHLVPASRPQRDDAFGRWVRGDEAWSFESIEVVSRLWSVVEDVSAFDKTLDDKNVLADVCPRAKSDRVLIDAYESRRGGHRAGLVLCGTRATGAGCPDVAESHLHWVHLERGSDEWLVSEHDRVTDEALPQCPTEPSKHGAHYAQFSFAPLEMIASSMWGLGWTRSFERRGEEYEEQGVWLINTKADEPLVGEAQIAERHATVRERERSKSRVYLAPVDDTDGLDLCQVEAFVEERCRGLNEGCRAGESGHLKRTHIAMWKPDEARFDTYLLSKHRRCSADFDFAERQGYMLLYEDGRLGVLPSPAN